MATGTPRRNLTSMYEGLFGRFFVPTQIKASAGGSQYGSSSTPLSIARPQRF